MFARLRTAAAAATVMGIIIVSALAAGCSTVVKAHGSSMLYDPFHVGDLRPSTDRAARAMTPRNRQAP